MGSSLEFLKGKKVVIVGGSSGIGLAVAAASLSYGATVVIASSSEEKVNSAVKQLGGGDGNLVSGFTVDAGDELKLFAFFDKVGVFDHLVWTATDKSAVGYPDIDLSEHRNVFDNTFWGPAAAGKYIHEKKLMASGGSITTTTGTVWQRPRKGWSIGGAAGAARVTLAKGMAIDLSPIRVNIISLGVVDTPLWAYVEPAKKEALFKAQLEKQLVDHIASPEEVTDAYIFAMKCAYLTGQCIEVEGGRLLV